MTPADLKALKEKIQALAMIDKAEAIKALEKELPDGSPAHIQTMLLSNRMNQVNFKKIKGTISSEDFNVEYQVILEDLLKILTQLTEEDFAVATPDNPCSVPSQSGSILHKIPNRMQLGKDTKCVIRLAVKEEYLIQNISLDEDVQLDTIRVSDVMEVELLDPNGEPTFKIRSISSKEQFIDPKEYTEWIFYVCPLLSGNHPLILKVGLLEVINNKERKREIVLEENVHITTEPQKEEELAFSSIEENISGIMFSGMPQSAMSGGGSYPGEDPYDSESLYPADEAPREEPKEASKKSATLAGGIPSQPLYPPPSPMSRPSTKSKSTNRRKVGMVLSSLLVIGIFSIVISQDFNADPATGYPSDRETGAIVSQDPDKPSDDKIKDITNAGSSVVEGITKPIDTIPTPLDDIIPIEEEEITVAVIEKDPSFQAFIKENNIRDNEFKAILKADSVKVKKEYNNWKEGKKVNTRSLKTKRYVTQPRGDQE